jgi:hypothetical protein
LASVSPALTEEAVKDNVAAMSAAEIKRGYRASDVALMHCDFFGYMAELQAIGMPNQIFDYNMFMLSGL